MTEEEFIRIAHDLRQLSLRICGGYGLAPETIEDMAQDAMLKLWSVKGNILSDSHARGTIASISRHLCIDYFRQHKRHPSTIPIDAHPLDRVASHNSAPDIAMEEQENERWLQKKLKELPSNQYLVLHLRQVEKKSTEEIAAIVGITPGSVVTLLARARQKMLQEIRKKKR